MDFNRISSPRNNCTEKKSEMWNKNNVKAINTAEKNINNIVFYSFYIFHFICIHFTDICFIKFSFRSVRSRSNRGKCSETLVRITSQKLI